MAVPHPLLEARWPTIEEAARSVLFSPIRLGRRLTLRTRTWIPAMVPWRASENGVVTPAVVDWYRRFAAGRPGAIVLEATGIRDIPSGPLLRIGHDRFLPGLSEVVRAIAEASGGGTKTLIQVIDFLGIRRRPSPETYFARYLKVEARHREGLARMDNDPRMLTAPEIEVRSRLAALGRPGWSEVLSAREMEDLEAGHRERVTDVDQESIRELPRVLPGFFADAAARARTAGFDGVELHFAHAYTMASFLSRTNTRTDGYGGDLEGRARLGVEVLRAVRRRVGEDFSVGVRFLGDEAIPGGSDLADASAFAIRFAKAGADYLSISKGGKFDDARQPRIGEAAYPYTGPSGHECMPTVRIDDRGPFGRNVGLAAHLREALLAARVPVPVVTSGGLCTFDQVEGILNRREADIVAAARQSLADPDWWLKMEIGRGADVRRCTFTNYCEGLDQRHKQVTCKLWDRIGLEEPGIGLSEDGRRRLLPPSGISPKTRRG